jgi:uncharacterized membrane protein (DUF106 family)
MEFLNIVIDFLDSRFSLILYIIAATIVLFLYALWNDSKHGKDDDEIGFN